MMPTSSRANVHASLHSHPEILCYKTKLTNSFFG